MFRQPFHYMLLRVSLILKEKADVEGMKVVAMIVTTLSDRRRMKRWKFEREVLRKLSLEQLKQDAERSFRKVVPFYFLSHSYLLDPCMDMAIDAYLLGAEYSRFGYCGESEEQVLERCDEEVTELVFSLFNLLQGWLTDGEALLNTLHEATRNFIEEWWRKGFNEGKRRHRLRLQ